MFAAYDMFILSRIVDGEAYPWKNGYARGKKYPYMEQLIKRIKEINPDIKLFGYIPGPIDNPTKVRFSELNGFVHGGNSGLQLCTKWNPVSKTSEPITSYNPDPYPSWSWKNPYRCHCPEGSCVDNTSLLDEWSSIKDTNGKQLIDGIFFDVPYRHYITEAHRDSIINAAHKKGFDVMLNTQYYDIDFATESIYMHAGDWLLMESFYIDRGQKRVDRVYDAGPKLANLPKGLKWAAMAKDELNPIDINCNSQNHNTAFYLAKQYKASAFAHATGSLAIPKTTFYCPNTWKPINSSLYKECVVDCDCAKGKFCNENYQCQ